MTCVIVLFHCIFVNNPTMQHFIFKGFQKYGKALNANSNVFMKRQWLKTDNTFQSGVKVLLISYMFQGAE